jgi:hypothetical protein
VRRARRIELFDRSAYARGHLSECAAHRAAVAIRERSGSWVEPERIGGTGGELREVHRNVPAVRAVGEGEFTRTAADGEDEILACCGSARALEQGLVRDPIEQLSVLEPIEQRPHLCHRRSSGIVQRVLP